MTAIYLCEAVEKKDTFLKLRVYIINPECPRFYYSKSFILNLLFDYSNPQKSGDILVKLPLYLSIPRYSFNVHNYFLELKDEIISDINVRQQINYYPDEGSLEIQNWKTQLAELPLCVFDIWLTDKKWIMHIDEKDKWTSGATDWE
ncbi:MULTISPECIES: hypothetical protein [unclassified Okeania]|uniref:hypothetical protein n=1 Tax=unclassified Okeania TaxID=2634635 RepID=UPI0013BA6008|nr:MULTISPECIES: hypothetical protein [unclassified Okeania]NES77320.1 hypothetical protein [Okeania sp. SIO1H4]NET13046.1 hypothetical protein [Okeania sp. SIO1H6]NET22704.1 hypothetical protein [Okeania sp. SIO1H5]NET95826.1 hypothetical protein [Okeania sp. SIO1H2]